MMGGFKFLPDLKDVFKPSEYNPKWAVVYIGPIIFILLIFAMVSKKFKK